MHALEAHKFNFYFLFCIYVIYMAEQLQTLLKYVKKNPDLLEKAMSFAQDNAGLISAAPAIASTVQNVLSPSGVSGSAPLQPSVVESLQSVASVDNVTESINTASTLFNIKYMVIGALVFWAFLIIIVRFLVNDEKTKKDIEFINTTLFGNSGIIPIILSVWVISVLAVTLLPAFTGVLPKMGSLADALSTFLIELPKLLPALV
jgi:hypothetical protein